jgi:Leucine-rich repeat (LRR) protein
LDNDLLSYQLCCAYPCFCVVFVVLQLCYNQFTGSIPSELGSLERLSVLALQSNHLTGAIPASLGDLGMLMRLDLSYNHFFGSVPTKVADAPLLEFLDIRNNSLSGNVPLGIAFYQSDCVFSFLFWLLTSLICWK